MFDAIPPEQARTLQGLIGSLVDTVLGGDTTEETTSAPTTRTPVPTTRTPTPTTRSPTPTTTTPAATTKTPVTTTPQPTTAVLTPTPSPTPTPTPTPSSTPESTPEPSSSSSESLLTEAPETPIPTIKTNSTSADSLSASTNGAFTAESSSGSIVNSDDDRNSQASLGDGLASSQAIEVVADSPVNTWMIIAITLGAVSIVILCVGLIAWCVRRRNRDDDDKVSPSFHRHLMISVPGKVSDDTVNTRLDTSSTGPYTERPRQDGGAGYSASFLTAAQGSMWEDDTITAMRIPLEKLTKGKLLSKGGYGMVYRGSYRGEPVAIKTLLPESRKTLGHINAFLAEIKMMAALEHPRIVRLVGVAWDSLMDLCCVSEYMEGGDLRSLLNYVEYEERRPHGFDLEKARIALHVAHALTYLHSLDPLVLHRDLKSKNILLSENRDAKITDFGVSRESSDSTMTAGVGTSLWMAPEVMMGERYGSSADIFSFGVVLSELDSHVLPYAAAKEAASSRVIPDTALLQLVSLGLLRVKFSPHAPQALIDLAHECVDLDPDARPKAGEVLYRLQLIMKFTRMPRYKELFLGRMEPTPCVDAQYVTIEGEEQVGAANGHARVVESGLATPQRRPRC